MEQDDDEANTIIDSAVDDNDNDNKNDNEQHNDMENDDANVESASEAIPMSTDDVLLLQAATQGNMEEVRFLIAEREANVNCCDVDDGKTPLHLAACEDHLEVIQYLVQQGADKEEADNEGRLLYTWQRESPGGGAVLGDGTVSGCE